MVATLSGSLGLLLSPPLLVGWAQLSLDVGEVGRLKSRGSSLRSDAVWVGEAAAVDLLCDGNIRDFKDIQGAVLLIFRRGPDRPHGIDVVLLL